MISSLQRFVPAPRRPAPPPPPPAPAPQTPNPGAKATLLLNKPAVPANTAAERYNEVSVGRVEVPALRKKEETVIKKIEEAEEILGKEEEAAAGNGREGKSLVNTFPFNQRNGGGHHGHHDHHHDHGLGLAPPPPPTQSFLAPASSRNEPWLSLWV